MAMREKKTFTFAGIAESVQLNLTTTAVFVPHHINIELPRGRYKVIGLMNGVPFSTSLQFRKDVGRFFSINSDLMHSARIAIGETVDVSFRLINPEKVEIPEERETVVIPNDKEKRVWKTSSLKLDKVLAAYVDSAKKIDSRMKRAIETVQKSKAELLQTLGPKKKKKKNL